MNFKMKYIKTFEILNGVTFKKWLNKPHDQLFFIDHDSKDIIILAIKLKIIPLFSIFK